MLNKIFWVLGSKNCMPMSLVIDVLFFSTLSFVVPCWKTIFRKILHQDYASKECCNNSNSWKVYKCSVNQQTLLILTLYVPIHPQLHPCRRTFTMRASVFLWVGLLWWKIGVMEHIAQWEQGERADGIPLILLPWQPMTLLQIRPACQKVLARD